MLHVIGEDVRDSIVLWEVRLEVESARTLPLVDRRMGLGVG